MNGGTGLQLGSNIQSHACSAESGGEEVTLSDEGMCFSLFYRWII